MKGRPGFSIPKFHSLVHTHVTAAEIPSRVTTAIKLNSRQIMAPTGTIDPSMSDTCVITHTPEHFGAGACKTSDKDYTGFVELDLSHLTEPATVTGDVSNLVYTFLLGLDPIKRLGHKLMQDKAQPTSKYVCPEVANKNAKSFRLWFAFRIRDGIATAHCVLLTSKGKEVATLNYRIEPDTTPSRATLRTTARVSLSPVPADAGGAYQTAA